MHGTLWDEMPSTPSSVAVSIGDRRTVKRERIEGTAVMHPSRTRGHYAASAFCRAVSVPPQSMLLSRGISITSWRMATGSSFVR
jgi:hypothetical protein